MAQVRTRPPAVARIHTITFDWGDTLAINFGMPYLATQQRAFTRLAKDLAELGCTIEPGFIDSAKAELGVEWRRSISMQENPQHKEFDFAAMLDGWVSTAGGMQADPHLLLRAIERCTTTLTNTVIPFADAQHLLSLLKARGYRIGILSHVPWPGPACRAWFQRHALAPYIDFYSLSCEIGWIKPNPRHYQHALDQANCPANQVLHVGDHPERDINGAKRFGFRTCLRVTENIYPSAQLEACQADAQILHLNELPGVLDTL
jgi:FMN phosphatase YigB (HAD superfamily)